MPETSPLPFFCRSALFAATLLSCRLSLFAPPISSPLPLSISLNSHFPPLPSLFLAFPSPPTHPFSLFSLSIPLQFHSPLPLSSSSSLLFSLSSYFSHLLIQSLLNPLSVYPLFSSQLGLTALMQASVEGHAELVSLLLANGADISAVNSVSIVDSNPRS